MSKTGQIKDVLPGGFSDTFLFLRQQRIKSSTGDLDLVLPGEIVRCAGASAFACTGAGVIVLDDVLPVRAARIAASVDDSNYLVETIFRLGKSVEKTDATGFAVRLHAKMDVGDLVAKAASAAGCVCSGSATNCQGSLSVGLIPAKGNDYVWSDPVPAVIKAETFPASAISPSKKECAAISVGPNATACYGSWRMTWNGWLPETYTVCVGGCSSGDCCIRRTGAGTCVKSESGWKSCSCM